MHWNILQMYDLELEFIRYTRVMFKIYLLTSYLLILHPPFLNNRYNFLVWKFINYIFIFSNFTHGEKDNLFPISKAKGSIYARNYEKNKIGVNLVGIPRLYPTSDQISKV